MAGKESKEDDRAKEAERILLKQAEDFYARFKDKIEKRGKTPKLWELTPPAEKYKIVAEIALELYAEGKL